MHQNALKIRDVDGQSRAVNDIRVHYLTEETLITAQT